MNVVWTTPGDLMTTDTLLTQGMAQDRMRQSVIGLALAILLIGSWLALHITTIFFWPFPWSEETRWLLPFAVLGLTWLYVAIFIVAHDCMHGTVTPSWPWLNPWIGRLCLFLYAAFSFDRMREAHRQHHQNPATEHDPDFDAREDDSFWFWYLKFFAEYFGFREFMIVFAVTGLYMAAGAPYQALLMFWMLPSMLSSLQLFVFGTYLPHRRLEEPYTDRHRTRSNDYPWIVSLLTCLHFGYHHEHHSTPGVPWWRLPQLHAQRRERRT